jgi:hypothetical protein
MGKIVAWLIVAAPGLLRDAVGVAGAMLLVYGLWLIYVPAAFIVGGVMLLAWAIIATLNAP